MNIPFSRRALLQAASASVSMLPAASTALARPRLLRRHTVDGWVRGRLSGADAVVETLKAEGCDLVFGIPGAQENELWDAMKSRNLPYLLAAHEMSAACMADGYARATGRPGVVTVVPGPGVTNAMTGLGEALLDSIPVVAIVGDIARGEKFRPFQVHALNQKAMLETVCKCVLEVKHVSGIPTAIRQAFAHALEGEPGPTAVVIPYNLLIEMYHFDAPPLAAPAVPFDERSFQQAVTLLSRRNLRVGIYAGLGCMDYAADLARAAEALQAPVATSVSGKGAISEYHPLAVGWGYGPQGSAAAEAIFKDMDVLLAIGVKFSEVSTGYYANPRPGCVIQVDANPCNLGRILKADVAVHADAGLFLSRLLECPAVRRSPNPRLMQRIRHERAAEAQAFGAMTGTSCGVHPMQLIRALRCHLPDDALLFVDVTVSEHLAAEGFRVCQPRTYFNPTDNQAMGWSIPASLGAQRACPGRTVATLTGDGCFLMTAMELSTAARACLPVKFFILDDCAYHYMQMLQWAAYRRVTATRLARIDYAAFAKGLGIAYAEICQAEQLAPTIAAALAHEGPVLCRVAVDYRNVKIRWIEAVRDRYTEELTLAQKARFLARIGARTLDPTPRND